MVWDLLWVVYELVGVCLWIVNEFYIWVVGLVLCGEVDVWVGVYCGEIDEVFYFCWFYDVDLIVVFFLKDNLLLLLEGLSWFCLLWMCGYVFVCYFFILILYSEL